MFPAPWGAIFRMGAREQPPAEGQPCQMKPRRKRQQALAAWNSNGLLVLGIT